MAGSATDYVNPSITRMTPRTSRELKLPVAKDVRLHAILAKVSSLILLFLSTAMPAKIPATAWLRLKPAPERRP